LELRQLRYYIGVVDSGSVSRAAQCLFVAQSALSKQISDLEQELDAKLLVRARSGVRLTESGKIFYDHAQAVLKLIDDARTAVHCAPDAIVGSVVVGVPQSAWPALALPLLRAARERYPLLSLHLNEELTGNLFEQLRQGRVDLAIFGPDVPLTDFEFEPVISEELYWICNAQHARAARTEAITLEDIAAEPLLLSAPAHKHCMRAIVEQVFAEHEFPMPRVTAEINSVQALKSAVMAGMAPTILPVALAAHEIDTGQLVARRIEGSVMQRTLGICMAHEATLTRAKLAVRALIRDTMRSLCASGRWRGARALPPCDAGC
jgi:LysR family nitrogen assimilation transcriptional regulator